MYQSINQSIELKLIFFRVIWFIQPTNGLYAQLHYFLNFSQLLLPLLAKLINSGVSDYCCHDY